MIALVEYSVLTICFTFSPSGEGTLGIPVKFGESVGATLSFKSLNILSKLLSNDKLSILSSPFNYYFYIR